MPWRRVSAMARSPSARAGTLPAAAPVVRARLALDAGLAAGLPDALVHDIAAGCELLHNAALVHDDLQDRDDARRGRAAIWARFGISTAISTGDLMISAAYMALASSGSACVGLAHDAVARTIRGQHRDLAAGPDCTALDCARIATSKSGPLLALPIRVVLARAGADMAADARARETAGRLARAYQIVDDIADRERDAASGAPNMVLSLRAAGCTEAGALHHATAMARRALGAATRSAAGLPSQTGTAYARLAATLAHKLPESADAA